MIFCTIKNIDANVSYVLYPGMLFTSCQSVGYMCCIVFAVADIFVFVKDFICYSEERQHVVDPSKFRADVKFTEANQRQNSTNNSSSYSQSSAHGHVADAAVYSHKEGTYFWF